ncbi:ATP-binding protein [Xanthomonas campestris]|uniref:ATP-dependent nuclease n=1 Tax=Xanthomonas TaxID=338 RepID=UPI001E44DB45|nr:ATP-binding protein [Xanthomonas campestris]MCC5044700.1 ATP-binding protein [Xanthomonas campestris]
MDNKNRGVKSLRNLLAAGKLEPYIRHIRFPHYKNLVEGTRIDFTYPITALVGANGTNKSSVIRALYGAPQNNNLGNLWFSTSIDPIEDDGARSCFIYGYQNSDAAKVVEVLKTRIHKQDDPDYWEPSRPVAAYQMEKMPKAVGEMKGRSKTRWSAIEKDVVYLDFRATLSAFDKLFYHGELKGRAGSNREKKDLIRSRSPYLKRAIDEGLIEHNWHMLDRVFDGGVKWLGKKEVGYVSSILGRSFEKIGLIRHYYFNVDAYTCRLVRSGMEYTEAFAGSGEFSVVRIVNEMMSANDGALVLLDEPEVSLHPGAQKRLMDFFTEMVKEKKLQVVLSTHSPTLLLDLPPDAIKVFKFDEISSTTQVPRQDWVPEEAFFHLGESVAGIVTVVVEDALAEAMVRRALIGSDVGKKSLFEVKYFPGGADTLWKYYVPIFSAEARKDLLVLLDGDKRPAEPVKAGAQVAGMSVEELDAEILKVTGVKVGFNVDGSGVGVHAQKLDLRRQFLAWIASSVRYLPGNEPEDYIWSKMDRGDAHAKGCTAVDVKEKFAQLARAELGLDPDENLSSSEILATQRRRLATIDPDDDGLAGVKACLDQSYASFKVND